LEGKKGKKKIAYGANYHKKLGQLHAKIMRYYVKADKNGWPHPGTVDLKPSWVATVFDFYRPNLPCMGLGYISYASTHSAGFFRTLKDAPVEPSRSTAMPVRRCSVQISPLAWISRRNVQGRTGPCCQERALEVHPRDYSTCQFL